MKLTTLGLLIVSTLCGCAMLEEENADKFSNEKFQSTYSSNQKYLSDNTSTPLESSVAFQRQFQNKLANHSQKNKDAKSSDEIKEYNEPISGTKLNINHYSNALMQDLVENLQYVNSSTPVAVVSFVMLDSDYNQSNLLGNQMAESLIHELHKFGIPVIDYKTTGFIRITELGDFAFSKDYEELGDSLVATYILGGTMTHHKDGYLVNARVVNLTSKAVVATAQNFIPSDIADSLIDKDTDTSTLSSQSTNVKTESTDADSNKTQENTPQISLVAK